MAAPNDAESGDLDPEWIEALEIGFVRRGLDPAEVQSLLARVADDLRVRRRREHELSSELEEARTRVVDLEAVARDLDERRQAAESQASVRAGEELAQAETDAAKHLEAAKQEGRELVHEAKVVRRRVLEDLARRRTGMRHQIDQLRAGRERLLEAYEVVGQTMGEATDELNVALPEARAAADRASHAATPEESVEDLEAEIESARMAGLPIVEGDEVPEPTSSGSSPEGPQPGQARSPVPLDRDVPDMPEVEPVVSDFEDVRFIEPERQDAAGEGDTTLDAAKAPEGGPEAVEPESAGPESAGLFERIREETGAVDGREPFDVALADPEEAEAPDPGRATVDLGAEVDDSTEAVAHDLARRLKRLLSDEQNELLDRLRRDRRRSLAVVDLLDDLDSRVTRFAEAVEPHLAAATVDGDAVDDLAAELAREVAESLADALSDLEATGADERDAVAGEVRRCYRTWKSDRIGAVAHRYVEAAQSPVGE